jgi:hypothetical protein
MLPRSLERSATLGAEAAGGLVSYQSITVVSESQNQSISAFPESPSQARFRGKVIILDFDHNGVLEIATLSVLKLPVAWPATKVTALSSRVQVQPISAGKSSYLTSITTQYWRERQDPRH